MDREYWIGLAMHRISLVLETRLIACMKQLEVKICECGRMDRRPNPHFITYAVELMLADGQLSCIEHPTFGTRFYVRTDRFRRDEPAQAQRVRDVFKWYSDFRTLCERQEACGDALEILMWNALDMAGYMNPVDISLPDKLAFDFTIRAPEAEFVLLGEVKNNREWVYPGSKELWQFIYKACLAVDQERVIVPVFVSRKILYATRKLFKAIGILGLDVHKQYFSPAFENQLKDIRHCDRLGYHDVTCDVQHPPQYVVEWFRSTLPKYGPEYAQRFRQIAPDLLEVSKELGWSRVTEADRKEKLDIVREELGIFGADYLKSAPTRFAY